MSAGTAVGPTLCRGAETCRYRRRVRDSASVPAKDHDDHDDLTGVTGTAMPPDSPVRHSSRNLRLPLPGSAKRLPLVLALRGPAPHIRESRQSSVNGSVLNSGRVARSGPPHLRPYRTSANLLRSHRPTHQSSVEPESDHRGFSASLPAEGPCIPSLPGRLSCSQNPAYAPENRLCWPSRASATCVAAGACNEIGGNDQPSAPVACGR